MCKHRCGDKKACKHACCKEDVKEKAEKRQREDHEHAEEPRVKSVVKEESRSVVAEPDSKIWVATGWKNPANTCDPATLAVMQEEVKGFHIPANYWLRYWLRYSVLRDAVLRGGHAELRRVLAPLKLFMKEWCTPGNGESVEEMLKRANAVAGTNLTRKDLEDLIRCQIGLCRGRYGVFCGGVPWRESPDLICGKEHLRPGQRPAVSREDAEDARFQIFHKYRAWGYNSPREMMRNEPEMAEAAGVDEDDDD